METVTSRGNKTKKNDLEYTINICKLNLSISKPLIPLKTLLFCFYGAGSFSTGFLTVYFKQRGVTLAELSTAYMVSPIVQIVGTLLSGIIADKIGRSKPVLVANLALTLLAIICIMLVPRPNYVDCNEHTTEIDCDSHLNIGVTRIKFNQKEFQESVCYEKCMTNTKNCRTSITKSSIGSSLPDYERNKTIENLCASKNFTLCECNSSNRTFCSVICTDEIFIRSYDEGQRSSLSIVIMLLYILWMTAFSNAYRMCDVAAMYLVAEYNADYGRQRLFCMIGNVIFSSLAGYLVNITTPENGEKNSSTAFYLFIILMSFCILIVYKLDVRTQPPGKKMGKKARVLLKNPDILSFAFVLFILGTSWVFSTKFVYWYLEEMQAPSVLIGLIPAVGALYGLPFLSTSEWWMKTIGTTKFFIVGLLGYVVYGIGYSFLKNPWMSLLLESTNIVTYHLLWVAVILRSHEIAPEGLTATVISAAGSIHFQIGKSSGSLIARVVMNHFGGPTAYRFLAVMCFIAAVLYSLYLYFRHYCKRKSQVLERNCSKADEKTVSYVAS